MNEIHVRYVAQLRQAAGCHEERVAVTAPLTLTDLLRKLAADHGEPLRGFLLQADGSPRSTLLVAIGDRQCPSGESPLIERGTVVTLMAPMSGG